MVHKLVSAILLVSILFLTSCQSIADSLFQASQPPAVPTLILEETFSIPETPLQLPPTFTVVIPTETATVPPTPVITATLDPSLPTATPTPLVLGLTGFPPGINPLTGLAVDDPSLLDRRPVMVKVSNYPRSGRPHAGLSYADVVFEYYIGEECNRFLAVYYGQDAPKVGPMRSGRLVDAQLVFMYQGVLAYGNADPQVDEVLVEKLGKRAISFNDSPCPPVCGHDTHSVTGVFVDTAGMSKFSVEEGVDNIRQDLNGMIFNEKPWASDQFGIQVAVQYSRRDRGEWHYDTETGKYLRWIEAEKPGYKDQYYMIPLVDRLNNEQITFSNVIIIFANYIEYAPTLHEIEILNNTEGQRAVLFRDGLMIEGKWRTVSPQEPIHFTDLRGIPLGLKPGNTWIVIAGMSSSFEEVSTGIWEMHFALP